MRAGALAALLVLTACSGAPVGWGGTHEVVAANPASITIRYDSLMGGYSAMQPTAASHCQQYGKSAVPTTGHSDGYTNIQVFECR